MNGNETIEAELTAPIPGLAYTTLRLRAARTVPPGDVEHEGERRRRTYDELIVELANAMVRERNLAASVLKGA